MLCIQVEWKLAIAKKINAVSSLLTNEDEIQSKIRRNYIFFNLSTKCICVKFTCNVLIFYSDIMNAFNALFRPCPMVCVFHLSVPNGAWAILFLFLKMCFWYLGTSRQCVVHPVCDLWLCSQILCFYFFVFRYQIMSHFNLFLGFW